MRIPLVKYIGSAISHFQAEPFMYDESGKPIIVSDWEFELAENLKGRRDHIKGVQRPDTFPRFLKYKAEYVQRSADLGENMFRFSLDFPRLSPREGEFNTKLMADYVKVLALIRTRAGSPEPMLTLFHWPMPLALASYDRNGDIRAGGWEHPAAVRHFRWYIKRVFDFLADKTNIRDALAGIDMDNMARERLIEGGLARYFISINEPGSILLPGYLTGDTPPFKKWRLDLALKVVPRLVEAHDAAAEAVRSYGGLVGIAHQWPDFDGGFGWVFRFLGEWATGQFERNGNSTDFIGLQYYFRETVPLTSRRGRVYSDNPLFGEVYPAGIERMLERMHAQYPSKRIWVTEFGFSDRSDVRRPYWILETMRYIFRAAEKGVPIDGILLWSLANNFEWALGMSQKFGLFDEGNLGLPLRASSEGVHGWEAWKAIVAAVKSPSPEMERELDRYYERARSRCPSADRFPLV